jgi:predicted nucleotidyltransferase
MRRRVNMAGQDEENALLDAVSQALSPIAGVAAIVLGGSRGRRRHRPDSDYDIGLYYRRPRPFDPVALDVAAAELDDDRRSGLVTQFGGWGPWVDGGGWLKVGGHAVDLIYRDLERVDRILDDALAGRYERNYQQGHPAGFPSIIYAGEIATCQVLWDPDGAIESRKRRLSPYPEPLRATVVARSIDEARFSVLIGLKGAKRGDVAYVAGCAYRAAACVTQALFALNREWWLNEKGSVLLADSFAATPRGFRSRMENALAGLGTSPSDLEGALEAMAALADETEALTIGPNASKHRC